MIYKNIKTKKTKTQQPQNNSKAKTVVIQINNVHWSINRDRPNKPK